MELDLAQNLPAIRFKAAVEIMDLYSGNPSCGPVKDTGEKNLKQGVVTFFSPAAHQIVAVFMGLDETRDLFRIILEIRVHGENNVSSGLSETCRKGHGFPKICLEDKNTDLGIPICNVLKDLLGAVRAAVIYKYQFVVFVVFF